MKRQFLLTRLLLLFALIVGSGNVWAAEGDTHDFAQTINQSLNDNASVSPINIEEQSYPIKQVIVTYAYNKSNDVKCSVSVGGSSWGQQSFSTTSNLTTYMTLTFSGSSIKGGVVVSFTNNSGSGNGKGTLKITNVRLVEGSTAAPAHTITALSNNNEYGTVDLSGTTITAKPKSGYRVSKSTPYNITSGTATVAQSGNYFSVTASTDCTVRINFEAIPNYTITINTPTGGTLTVKNGDDDVSNGDNLPDGTVLTITATPDAEYNFRNWQAIDASTHTYTASNTGSYTINEHAVTFNANFDAKVYHNAIFKTSGGTTYAIKTTEKGQAIDFPDNPSDVGGKVFKGWTTTDIVGTTDEAPEYVNSANMGDEDVTYYAVYATQHGDNVTAQLTNSEIISNIASSAMAYGTAKTYNDTSDGVTWVASGYTDAASRHWVQMKKASDSYFKITAPANINEVKVTISNTSNSKGGINDISKHGAFEGTVCLESSAKSTPTGACGSSDDVEDNVLTIVPTTPAKEFYLQVTAGARVWGIDIKYANLTYNGYCTTITEPITITDAGYATLCSDKALDFSGTNITAYTATDGKTKVTLNEITSGKVPANTPVVLHNADADGTPVDVPVIASADAVGDNDLAVVTDEEGKVGVANMFVLSKPAGKKVGFYVWEVGSTLNKGKVYLQGKASYESRSFLGFDDETTGIEAVDVNTENANATREFYNLNGQRVTTPTKGLYIVNGKKVIFNK